MPEEIQGTVTETTETTPAAQERKTTTYTEEDYLRMSSSQYAKGMADAMKEAGFEGSKGVDFKQKVSEFKTWQDNQKSDLEKAQEAANTAAASLAQKEAETIRLTTQLEALKKGADPACVEDVVVLAGALVNDDTDITAAVEKVLTKYPQFKSDGANTPPSPLNPVMDPSPQELKTTNDRIKNKLSKLLK